MKSLRRFLFATAGVALTIAALAQSAQAVIVRGNAQPLGQGTISSYVTLDRNDRITDLGVVFSESALTNLPEHEAAIQLTLPKVAAPFDFVVVNWNPHGHIPEAIYNVPHFDFHFFTITPGERQQITAVGEDQARVYRTPDSRLVPAGYVMAPESGAPGEGSHWINPQSSEFQGQPHGFDHTFIYGFYDGRMDFVEPMITVSTLETRRNFSEAIPAPSQVTEAGLYPTRYSLTYDASSREYRVSLSDLRSR